jgi:Fic family protein
MVSESVKTSEIEGEFVSRWDVASSIRRHFGLHADGVTDARAKGLADIMVSVHRTFADPLTDGMLFQWHRALFEENVQGYRTHLEPMQVVSGRIDRPTIHFEAPPSHQIPEEMARFIQWFNMTAPGQSNTIVSGPVRSALAHLYFESIHPFEDGNGRIGRAIAEKALAQGLKRPVLMSLSQAIEFSKSQYYDALESAQSRLDVTEWLHYFVSTVLTAQATAEIQIEFILHTALLFDRYTSQLLDRQAKVIRRMLAEGPGGFLGGMSAQKYAAIAKVSKATATRDLHYLVEIGVFFRVGGDGPSTRYEIASFEKGAAPLNKFG